jgi:hypothetical protein
MRTLSSTAVPLLLAALALCVLVIPTDAAGCLVLLHLQASVQPFGLLSTGVQRKLSAHCPVCGRHLQSHVHHQLQPGHNQVLCHLQAGPMGTRTDGQLLSM